MLTAGLQGLTKSRKALDSLGIKLLMIFGIITPYDRVLFYLEVERFSSFIQILTIKLLHVLLQISQT